MYAHIIISELLSTHIIYLCIITKPSVHFAEILFIFQTLFCSLQKEVIFSTHRNNKQIIICIFFFREKILFYKHVSSPTRNSLIQKNP